LAIGEVGKDSPTYEFLEDIKGAVERAAVLTRQLLAFSRKQIRRTSMRCWVIWTGCCGGHPGEYRNKNHPEP
jgi:RNase adaptor protein for sRNA GlmZ degradation